MGTYNAASDGHSANLDDGSFFSTTGNNVLCVSETTESAKRMPWFGFAVDIPTDTVDDVIVTAGTLTLKTDETTPTDKYDDISCDIFAERAWRSGFEDWQLRYLPSSYQGKGETTVHADNPLSDANDLSFKISGTAGWPTSNFFALLEVGTSAWEIVRCTSLDGGTGVITIASGGRGQFGSTAQAHAAGAAVRIFNADIFERMRSTQPQRRTTENTNWQFTEAGNNTERTSPSLVDEIQEVVDLALSKGTAVQRLGLMLRPEHTQSSGDDKDGSFWSLEASDPDAVEAYLTLTWVEVLFVEASTATVTVGAEGTLTVDALPLEASTATVTVGAEGTLTVPSGGVDLTGDATLTVGAEGTLTVEALPLEASTATVTVGADATPTILAELPARSVTVTVGATSGGIVDENLEGHAGIALQPVAELFVLGDSWAFLSGMVNDERQAPISLFREKLHERGLTTTFPRGYAVSGTTAQNWADIRLAACGILDELETTASPNVLVFMTLGANDNQIYGNSAGWNGDYWTLDDLPAWDDAGGPMEDLQANLTSIVDDLLAAVALNPNNPTVEIWLASYTNFPVGDAWGIIPGWCKLFFYNPTFSASDPADVTDTNVNTLAQDYIGVVYSALDTAYTEVRYADLWQALPLEDPPNQYSGVDYDLVSDCLHLERAPYLDWIDALLDELLPGSSLFTPLATLTIEAPLTGDATLTVGAEGSLTVDAAPLEASTATLTVGAEGTLTVEALPLEASTATVTITADATGLQVGEELPASTATVTMGAEGTLTVDAAPLESSTATVTVGAEGALTVPSGGVDLTGDATLTVGAEGTLTVEALPLEASTAGLTTSTTGTLTIEALLAAGQIDVVIGGDGTLTVLAEPLPAGAATITVTAAGGLSAGRLRPIFEANLASSGPTEATLTAGE